MKQSPRLKRWLALAFTVLPLKSLPAQATFLEETFSSTTMEKLAANGWRFESDSVARLVRDRTGEQVLAVAPNSEKKTTIEFTQKFEQIPPEQVWYSISLKPNRAHNAKTPPPPTSSPVGFYFNRSGDLVVYDGRSERGWEVYELGPLAIPEVPFDYLTIAVVLDYRYQAWSIWLDGKRIASNLGFAFLTEARPALTIEQSAKNPVMLDRVTITSRRPDGLAGSTGIGEDGDPELMFPVRSAVHKPQQDLDLFVPLE